MAEREIERWITVNGARVPIFAGESEKDAINRSIADRNEKTRQEQIARNKEEADRQNEKPNSLTSKTGLWHDPEYDRVVSADAIKSQYEKMVEEDILDPNKTSLEKFAKDNFTELDNKKVAYYKEMGMKFPSTITKSVSTTIKANPKMRTESGMAEVMYGKPFKKLTESQKNNVTTAVEGYKEALTKIAKSHLAKVNTSGASNKALYDEADKLAKRNGVSNKLVQKDAFNEFSRLYGEYWSKKNKKED